jgi:hypothetical protein
LRWGTGGGLPSVGSCSYRPDTKEAKLKKGTTATDSIS